jgi:trimethylamine--corrinoid protein Co-methyltransferase
LPDAQAGHEKTLTGICAAMAGANLIYGAGMLDSGLIFSYAQLLIDNDIFKMIRKVMQGMHIDDENLAVDIIKSVGSGGDFLIQEHTMKYMRTLPSKPNLIERGNRDNWLESGGKGLAERAAERAAEILANHKPVPLSDDAKSALRSIVEESDAEMEEMNNKR